MLRGQFVFLGAFLPLVPEHTWAEQRSWILFKSCLTPARGSPDSFISDLNREYLLFFCRLSHILYWSNGMRVPPKIRWFFGPTIICPPSWHMQYTNSKVATLVALALDHLNMSELPEPIMGSGNCYQVNIEHHHAQKFRQIPPCSEDSWLAAQEWSQDTEVVRRNLILIHVINEIQEFHTVRDCDIAQKLANLNKFVTNLIKS